jgi:hypothetical protein
VRHGTEIVNLGRFACGNDIDKIGGIAQITVMQKELDARFVPIAINVINATRIETRRTTDNAMDLFIDLVSQ